MERALALVWALVTLQACAGKAASSPGGAGSLSSGGNTSAGTPSTNERGGTNAMPSTGGGGANGSGGVSAPNGGGGASTTSGGEGASATSGGVAVSGGAPVTGPARDDHTPIAVVPGCVQPTAASTERVASELKVGASVLRTTEHDCAWTLGEPLLLPLTAEDPATLLFHTDVNADGVADLFFGGELAGASNPPMVLLRSRVAGGELTFERVACDSAWASASRTYFIRDLNGDDVPDFVMGRDNGLSAIRNLPGDQREVLHFDWPSEGNPQSSWVSILDVAVGDFDGDGRADIAVGYDRTSPEAVVELGVLLFRNRSASGTYGAPESLARADYGFGGSWSSHVTAYVASLPRGNLGADLYSLVLRDPNGILVDHVGPDGAGVFIPPSPTLGPTYIAGTRIDGSAALAIGGEKGVDFYDASPFALRLRVAASAEHPLDHELGGGPRRRGYFLVDLDGDGDDDLVERGSDIASMTRTAALWTHARVSATEFAPPTRSLISPSALSESPFIDAGPLGKRLVVTDGPPYAGDVGRAAVWPLLCNP